MRLILSLFLISSYLFATITSPIETRVKSIKDNEITIDIHPSAQVGMRGVVMHDFNENHSIALTWVEITKITEDAIVLKTLPILSLEQSALPTGKWASKVGDRVILALNYDRALLIAPDRSLYKKITYHHEEKNWVHPDLFAALLSFEGHPTPLKEDFSKFCQEQSIGTVSFMFDKSLITVDCHSFIMLENKSTTLQSEEPQLPFYTRIQEIEANWFGEGSDELEAYAPYYIELLAKYNPENTWMQEYYTDSLDKEKSSFFGNWFSNEEKTNDQNSSTTKQ